ncbi:DNA polymerase-4 [Motilibacter peucedani]|uniref:DNA polymerase IV n=1 Tax=Motilibacter peucedani TaxID=598650 RepID=A0A420XNP1_9ACTN|nr:DNA polymerase IV [Motilibacter peucedani]RKS73820.1 DNA polymerase-4 [Motilibacter peucedani]
MLPVAHLDLDAFYAAVEERQKPSLRGRAVVIAGRGGRGVVATANYKARELGVHSAMPSWQGRALAPTAAWISPRMQAYSEHSAAALAPLYATFERIEQIASDEVYIDLTSARAGAELRHDWTGDPAGAARALQRAVLRAVGLTCSVGVARHKLGAKLTSETAKPAGTAVLAADEEDAFLAALPAKALPGIGPVSAQKLGSAGIRTVGDLRSAGEHTLVGLLGSAHGTAMWDLAHGRDTRPVEHERVRKSVGSERTYARDLHGLDEVRAALGPVFADAYSRLVRSGSAARTVTVKLRYADFTGETRATSLAAPSDDERLLHDAAQRSLVASGAARPGALGIRLLGVAFSSLDEVTQLTLDAPERVVHDLAEPAEDPDEVEQSAGAIVAEDSAPGADVLHESLGRGWLVGAGHGVASVRFETSTSAPARTRGVPLGDALRHTSPEPPRPEPDA